VVAVGGVWGRAGRAAGRWDASVGVRVLGCLKPPSVLGRRYPWPSLCRPAGGVGVGAKGEGSRAVLLRPGTAGALKSQPRQSISPKENGNSRGTLWP